MSKKEATATAVAQRYTVYEKARLIGARALQISQGAPFSVKLSDDELAKIRYNPVEIAKREFVAGKIPIDIKRKTPE
jgi:DNA-directed RNA polymerase subunit K